MSVTQDEIKKISKLSNIALKDQAKTTNDINGILSWVEELNKVDTTGVEWTVNVLNTYNRMREDKISTEKNTELLNSTNQKVVANQISLTSIMK